MPLGNWFSSSGSRRSITPGATDLSGAVESQLTENKLIGLSWCLIDYDDVNAKGRVGFWNLSHKQTFYGNADQLVGFRLMPLEQGSRKNYTRAGRTRSST